MIEKGPCQVIYQPGGRIERLLCDRNSDGRADMVVMYGANGKPRVSEIDGNIDGVVDRKEYLSKGLVFLEELDTDHDGKADRRLFRAEDGAILKIDVDKDGDGFWETSLPVKG